MIDSAERLNFELLSAKEGQNLNDQMERAISKAITAISGKNPAISTVEQATDLKNFPPIESPADEVITSGGQGTQSGDLSSDNRPASGGQTTGADPANPGRGNERQDSDSAAPPKRGKCKKKDKKKQAQQDQDGQRSVAGSPGRSNGRRDVSGSVGNQAALPVISKRNSRSLKDDEASLSALLDTTAAEEPIDWESRAKSGSNLSKVTFPKGWEVPPPAVFRKYFRKVDFSKEIQRGTIKPFSGKAGDWPRFKQSFYESVHVQDASILTKCEALDALVPLNVADQYFFALGVSPENYKTRLERLIRKFDREDTYHERLLEQLQCLHKAGSDDVYVLERCVFAVKAFMDNAPVGERTSKWLLDVLFEYVPEDIL